LIVRVAVGFGVGCRVGSGHGGVLPFALPEFPDGVPVATMLQIDPQPTFGKVNRTVWV
jgi:hypothetical protein